MTIRFVIAISVALFCCAAAFAQQRPPGPPGSGSVVQTGVISPRHVTMWAANGVVMDAGSAIGGLAGTNPVEFGVTNTGTPLCVTDGPTSSPYHQLCLGANVNGAGLITYNAFQGATPQPMNCVINNVSIPNCLSGGGGGGGGVTGPVSSVNNDLASFNGTSGLVIKDSGFQANLLNPFTGDVGSGGTAGIVPAPPPGSAAAGKVLGAVGTWITPPTSGMLTLTGAVTGNGVGTVNTTFQVNGVTNGVLAQMPTNTIKGNNTGLLANALDLTATQVTAMLNAFVGDSGSGGTKGLVLAPSAGDAAAGKFLSASGIWSVPTGSGNVTGAASSTANDIVLFADTTGKVLKDGGLASSLLSPFTGDSGAGGVAGIVPAPPAGSAAAGRVLGANGTWVFPSTGPLTLTGVVTGTGTGTINTTFTANSVLNSVLAQMPANTIKGNNTGSTANPIDLTVTQATAMLNVFVGDSGSGGTKGLVIAPAAGDGAAGKFLKADGTWTVPAGAGNVTGAASSVTNDVIVFADTTGKVLKDSGVLYTSLAPLASPALTGTPTAPTAAQSTNSSQIATTQFVKSQWIPEAIGWIAGQNPNNAVLFTAGQAMTVQGITGRVEIANGSTATVTVNKAANGTACASGTVLHSGSFNANGTAGSNQTLTLVGGVTENLNVGDSICLQTGGGANWASGSAVGTLTIYATPQ